MMMRMMIYGQNDHDDGIDGDGGGGIDEDDEVFLTRLPAWDRR